MEQFLNALLKVYSETLQKLAYIWPVREGSLSLSDSNNPQQRILREVLCCWGAGSTVENLFPKKPFLLAAAKTDIGRNWPF